MKIICEFQNCSDFTSGNSCEICIEGYYKDETGDCSACLCPSREQNNAKSCKRPDETFECICKEGKTNRILFWITIKYF